MLDRAKWSGLFVGESQNIEKDTLEVKVLTTDWRPMRMLFGKYEGHLN